MSENSRTLSSLESSLAPTGDGAEATLRAINLGQADALVIETPDGPRVYTLRGAAEPYRDLVEHMSDAAIVLDADHTILYCNGGLARMLGRPGMAGHDLLSLVAPHQRLLAQGLLEAGAEAKSHAELLLIAADGRETPVRAGAAPLSFDGQPCVALVVTALDEIEALKVSAAALRQSEERYRNLVEHAQDGIFLADAEGHLIDVNSAGHTMLGYTRDEILSRTIADLHVPEETCQLSLELAKLVSGKVTRSEWRFRRKDGSEFTGENVGRQLPNGHFIGIVRDVTRRKRAEAVLRESEAYSRSLFESSPDCIKILSVDGRLEEMNGNGRCTMEVDDFEAVRGLLWKDLWPPGARAGLEAAMAEARAGRTAHFSGFCPTMKGVPKWWEVVITAVLGADGAPTRLIASSRDVTGRRRAEQKLQIGADRLRLATEMSATSCFSLDRDLRFTWLHAMQIGFGGGDGVGKTEYDHFIPESAERLNALYRQVLATGERRRQEMRVQSLFKTEPQEFSLVVEPLRDHNGIITGLIAAATNITEQKKTEETLRQNAALMRLASDAARMTYAEFDLGSGRLKVAENHAGVMGYAPALPPDKTDLARVADNLLSHVAPEDHALVQAAHLAFVGGKLDGSVAYRVIGDDGRERWIESRWNAEADENGLPKRGVAAHLDITERKRAEQALLESEERLRLALSGAKAAAWQWNILTGEMIWSPEGFDLYGRDPQRDLARYDLWRACLHPLDLAPTESLIHAVMDRTLPEYRTEYRIVRPNGDIRWLASAGRMEYDSDGTPLRLSGINLDITERKRTEQQLAAAKAEAERANRAKSKFLAAASHDLRQPVQSLVLLLSVLARHTADRPKAADAVTMMQSAVNGLSGLLTGILDISRLDAGVVEPAMQNVDVGGLLAPLCDEHRERAASASLKMLCARRPLRVCTDPVLLQRALRNLLENALRYTKTGGVLLGARTRGERVRIDVIDTGIGVAANQQQEIFEEFFQADNPGRNPGEGLGLGLAIVSRLAKLLGAEVELRSHPGRGSRFSLLLPRAQAIEAAPAPARAAAEASGGRILVIEDNEIVRQGLVVLMEDWGCQPTPVASGEAALERIAQGFEFDAIVADYRLGAGLTGVATAKEIAHRTARKIPTLVLTGDTGKEQIVEIEASGYAVLHKPVDAASLRRALALIMSEA